MGVGEVVMRGGIVVVEGMRVRDGRDVDGGVTVVGREVGRGEGVFDSTRVGVRVGGLGVNDGYGVLVG